MSITAIVLAAGVGRRLGSFTRDYPKCLLPMGDRTLLARTLDALAACGAAAVTIVVGHCADQIRAAAGDEWRGMPLSYVANPDYEQGSIVSLWCARAALGGDVLVMDADVLFPPRLLRRLVRSSHANCVLLDGGVAGSGEEMILCAAGARVWDIARRRPGQVLQPPAGVAAYDTYGESVGFLKVGRADAGALRAALEERVANGVRDTDHEMVYPAFFAACPVGYERVDDLPWTEIDFADDVVRARAEVLPRIDELGAA